MAMHMHFGTQIAFTYGPLGFLMVHDMYEPVLAACAFLFAAAVGLAIFGVLMRALRDVFPTMIAFIVAYVAGFSIRFVATESAGGGAEVLLALAFVVAVWILTERYRGSRNGLLAGLGVMLGAVPLIKISLGVGILAIALLVVVFVADGRLRAAGIIGLAATLSFAAGWFGTGNEFNNLVPFIKNSVPIVSGYSGAMAIGPLEIGWQKWLAPLVVIVVGSLAWTSVRKSRLGIRIGVALCTALVLWLLAKEAFVRFDSGHELILFEFTAVLICAFTMEGRRLWIVGSLAIAVVINYVVVGTIPSFAYRPDQSVRHFGAELLAFLTGGTRHRIMAEGRASMEATYKVPSAMLAHMRGHTVDVDPWEQNVTWAYPGSIMDPLPVIQDYSAYTSSLDRLDAERLRSRSAPSLILKQAPVAIDARYVSFEPPMTQVAMECRYQQIAANRSWQLLSHTGDRCGKLRLISTKVTRRRGRVRVSAGSPGTMIVGAFQLPSSLATTLESVAYRAPQVCMNARWQGNGAYPFRFIVGSAGDLHILRPSATLGYSAPFVPLSIDAFSFSYCGSTAPIAGARVVFYSIPMKPSSVHR